MTKPAGTQSIKISRIELVIILALILLGLGFRIYQISSASLDHYDEGVYAFSALGITDTDLPLTLFPNQVRFSPPLYFSLVGLSYLIAGGPSDTAALLVNVFLGTATILAVWWIGRSWFGAAAGIAAATLLTFNEFQIALSRTALTDIAFSLLLLIALATIAVAIQRQSIRLSVVAGLAVGLAWNTKYHGWFALVIAGAALIPFAWGHYRQGKPIKRLFILWGIIAIVALVTYLPWALFIEQQPGGYIGLTQYQRTLFSKRWLYNLWLQAQQLYFFEGPFSRISGLVAFFLAMLVSKRPIRSGLSLLLALVLLVAAALLIGGSGTATLLALLAIPFLLRKPESYSSWLLLAWLGMWVVTTPFYNSYARLTLPFIVAVCLAAGLSLSTLARGASRLPLRSLLATGIAVTFILALSFFLPNASNPWRSARSVPDAAEAMLAVIPAEKPVFVIGEPSLAFYLQINGRPTFEQLGSVDKLENLERPAYLVAGVYADRAPTLRQLLASLEERLVPLGTFPINPSDVRLLDDFLPVKARDYIAKPDSTFDLDVYLLQPEE